MIDSVSKRVVRTKPQNRRQEVEKQLAAAGLVRGPRRLRAGETTFDSEQARVARLRVALENLGPIFSSFGLYMSARADLWAVKNCLELAKISQRGTVTPATAIRGVLETEGGLEERFITFDDKPFESRLLVQSHYARLTDSTEVVVRIVHPEAESQFSSDLDLLPLLKDGFVGCGLSEQAFTNALADFSHTLCQQLNFDHELRAFELLTQDVEEYDSLYAPRVWRGFSTSRVLVVEKLMGLRLNEITSSLNTDNADEFNKALRSLGIERNELARLVCEVWLRQALRGRNFAVDASPCNIVVLPGKQIAFTGGPFAGLAAESQANLWHYLLAAANENSDKACFCLLKEMRKERTSERNNVRQRFRQAMPFRDGGWDATGDRQSLAELLFVQWRFASDCGYVPLNHLPPFYRGLFNVVDIARRVAPEIDPLAEGVRDLRLLTGLGQFGKMMSGQRLTEQIDLYTGMIVDLPQILDEALTSVSDGPPGPRLRAAESAGPRTGTSSAMVPALLLVLAAFVLVSHYIGVSALLATWTNRINTIVFMIVGALLLRAISRVK